MKMRTGLLAVGAACAACCAPLLVPALAALGWTGAGVAGGALLFGLTLDQALCLGLPAVVLVALAAVWGLRRARARRPPCRCQDRCGAESACSADH